MKMNEGFDSEVDKVYVDKEDGLGRLRGNAKLYLKLLNNFKNSASVQDLIKSIEENDSDKASLMAHTVKGVAANLSLKELANIMLETEHTLKNEGVANIDIGKIQECVNATLENVDKVISDLDG